MLSRIIGGRVELSELGLVGSVEKWAAFVAGLIVTYWHRIRLRGITHLLN